jgi:hypothetical protein
MSYGWVRGGNEDGTFLHHDDPKLVRAAARILRDTYGIEQVIIKCRDWEGRLEPHELDRFIKSGRLPS